MDIDTQGVLIFFHVLVFGYWLGADLGVFFCDSQLTREDLMEFSPSFVSELFRRIPGVRVEGGAVVGRRSGFGGQCQLRIFLDGLPMDGWDFDSIPPEYLEAMEVYQGLSVPIQYGPSCGVVLFWTRTS